MDIPRALGHDGQLVLLIFIVYYSLDTLFNFFLSGEYKTNSMGRLMIEPYGRIFIQQFVVIVGSMFLSFGFHKIFILILVLIKLYFELFMNFSAFIKNAEAGNKKKMIEETAKNQPKS